MVLVAVVSFFDYGRLQIIPAFIFDNYLELFQSNLTLRLYATAIKYTVIVWSSGSPWRIFWFSTSEA